MLKRLAIPTALALTIASCGIKPPMPQDKCARLVFEIHHADALLNATGLNDANLNSDSLSYYNYVFAKEGVTRKEFIDAIDWYSSHPDQYNDLYKKVIILLNKYEQAERARYEDTTARAENDIWDMRRSWNLPLDGEKNPVAFNIPVHEGGVFTLGADITYYKDDESTEPRMTLILEYEDETTSENSVIDIVKDGKEHHIEVILTSEEGKRVKCVRGWVLDHSSDTKSKHIDCYNISLKRTKE